MMFLSLLATMLMASASPSTPATRSTSASMTAMWFDSVRIVPKIPSSPSYPIHRVRAKIRNGILGISFYYSGGCRKHTYELVTTGMVTTSSPPQTQVYLLHDGHGDLCETVRIGSASFDLSPLETLITETTGDHSLVINIMMPGDSVPMLEPLLYEF